MASTTARTQACAGTAHARRRVIRWEVGSASRARATGASDDRSPLRLDRLSFHAGEDRAAVARSPASKRSRMNRPGSNPVSGRHRHHGDGSRGSPDRWRLQPCGHRHRASTPAWLVQPWNARGLPPASGCRRRRTPRRSPTGTGSAADAAQVRAIEARRALYRHLFESGITRSHLGVEPTRKAGIAGLSSDA